MLLAMTNFWFWTLGIGYIVLIAVAVIARDIAYNRCRITEDDKITIGALIAFSPWIVFAFIFILDR